MDTLVVLSDRILIFYLTKARRGTEYLHVSLSEDVPSNALQALLDVLKPRRVIRTETSRNILATHTDIVSRFFAESSPDFVEAFVKKDYAEHFISERDPFRLYYKPLYYLLDSLIGLGLYREALIIALAPYFLDPKEYKGGINRALSRVLDKWWKKFMFIDAPWQEIDTLGMIVILVPLCLLAFVIGPIIVFLNVKLPAIPVSAPLFFFFAVCTYIFSSDSPYSSLIYFHAGRRSLASFIIGCLLDAAFILTAYIFESRVLPWVVLLFLPLYLFLSLIHI